MQECTESSEAEHLESDSTTIYVIPSLDGRAIIAEDTPSPCKAPGAD
jgi:hypothetical protein